VSARITQNGVKMVKIRLKQRLRGLSAIKTNLPGAKTKENMTKNIIIYKTEGL
jgi:hypothetical protein